MFKFYRRRRNKLPALRKRTKTDDSSSSSSYEETDSSTDSVEDMDDDEIREILALEIQESPLPIFLKTDFGGRKTADYIGTLVTRVTGFLYWVLNHVGRHVFTTTISFYNILHKFIIDYPHTIPEYCEYLTTLLLKPSTIKNYIEDVWKSISWFVIYRPDRREVFSIQPGLYIIYSYV
jgi:hypothetical protein